MVAIAKLGDPAMLGRFGLTMAITAPVFAFFAMDMRSLIATDVQDEHSFGEYLGLRLISSVLALLLVSVIGISAGYHLEVFLVILAVGLAKSVESISDIMFGQIQKNHCMNFIGLSLMLKGLLSLVAMGLLLYFTNSLLWGVIGLAGVWTCMLFFFDRYNVMRFLKKGEAIKPSLYFPALRRLAWLAAPLGIMTMLKTLTSNIPRYFIEAYHGEAMLGYFTAIAYFLVVGAAVSNALRHAVSPRLAEHYVSGSREFIKLLMKLSGISIMIGSLGVVISLLYGKALLTLFFDSGYAKFANALTLVMIAGIALYVRSVVRAAMTVMRIIRPQAYVSALCVIISLLVGGLLIPDYGCMGGAWTLLITAWLSLFLNSGIVIYRIANNAARALK